MAQQLERSLHSIIFGQQIEYVCPIPLDECLRQLQSKSERGNGLFASKRKLHISLIFKSRSEYAFRLERSWGQLGFQTPVMLIGKLQAYDDSHTAVQINTQRPPLHNLAIMIILALPILAVLATGISQFMWFFIIFALILGKGVVVDDQRRRTLAQIVLQTLPPL